jgi:formylglycine-generating enzyme required for sulfatase activity
MIGMWKAVRMLRVIILTIGWLVFSYSLATSVHAGEDVNPPSGSPSVPDYLEGKLAAGTYLVLGTFEQKSNAHAFKQRYAKFDATVFAIKSKGKKVFRIVIGPVKKSEKRIIQTFLRKAGLESAWEMHIYPDKLPVKKRRENADIPPPEPEVLKEEGVYLVIGVFRDLSNAHRHRKRFRDFAPKVIAAKSKNRKRFKVVVGPVKKGEKKVVLRLMRAAGIKGAWEMRFSPDRAIGGILKSDVVVSKEKPKPIDEQITPQISDTPKSPGSLLARETPPPPPAPALPIPSEAVPATTQSRYKAGDTFSDCDTCPEMIVIPAGKFVMGEADGGMTGDAPATPVSIKRPIAMGRFEVTFAEWDACVSGGGCSAYKPNDEGWGRGKQPVTNINWNDALGYLIWLHSKTGFFYRLPTEAEWEYAARAGSTTNYWWGEEIGIKQAVCQDCGSIYDDKRSAPVGTFSPNPFGLYDTAGNLWEWTEDCYSMTSYKKHSKYPAAAPGPEGCSRVLRGGGWDIISTGLRSSFRFTSGSSNRSNIFGFRIVRNIK